jgi:hypothetical protein
LEKDDINPGGKAFYSDYMMETVLKRSAKPLGEIIGYELYPTYTYTRLYLKGHELKKHRDRESCEISATISLGIPAGEKINPIYMARNEDESDGVPIYLNPGDACIYRGCDLWHWRPPFENTWYLQSFIHFVDANGPHADFKFDKRPNLGYDKSYKGLISS